jgi:hypothetical protein
MTPRQRLARRMRFIADRIDPVYAPRYTGLSMLFVKHVGLVLTYDSPIRPQFCRLMATNADHELAYNGNDYYEIGDLDGTVRNSFVQGSREANQDRRA